MSTGIFFILDLKFYIFSGLQRPGLHCAMATELKWNRFVLSVPRLSWGPGPCYFDHIHLSYISDNISLLN